MKTTVLLFAICMFIVSCHEKNEKKISASELPQAVDSSFKAKYPDVKEVEWEMEKENGKTLYEGDFKLNGKEKEVEIDSSGKIVKDE